MPKITSSLLIATLLAVACTKPQARQVESGDLEVDVAIAPDPPSTGTNRLLVQVHDSQGRPVDGAQLSFAFSMPAMGAMPEMKGGGEVQAHGAGKYEVTYPLAMNGDWTLTLDVRAQGHAPAHLRLKVSPPRKGFVLEGAKAPSGQPGAAGGGAMLEIPMRRQQLIGVTYAKLERRALNRKLRAPGRIEVDETRLSEVTLKYDAYVEKLFVSQLGQTVKEGQPLLTLYSPELLAAEKDFLLARESAEANAAGARELREASERRLRLWDLSPAQLSELERSGKAEPRLTVHAPARGTVLEKNVVEGSRVMAGNTLYRIGNLGRIWVQADVFERDAALVRVGQRATMEVPWTSEPSEGRVSFISPTVDEKTRTVRARLEFANPGLALKPGMFVDVSTEVPLGEVLAVPASAVLVSGTHRYAFVLRGPEKLQPVEVVTGQVAGDWLEVRSGLAEGDTVATGATFLLSSEAQLRDALPRWSTP